ncbi:protein DcaA [Pasteurella multocida]|nr:protein DcaA [Pasteurella multocida]
MGYIFVRSFYTNQELGITSNPGYSRIKANFFAFGYFIGKTLPYDLFNLSNVSVYYRDKPNMTQPPMAKKYCPNYGGKSECEQCRDVWL